MDPHLKNRSRPLLVPNCSAEYTMGKVKKAGVNEKAAEAKQSKDAKKAAHKAASENASEDAEWAAAGEGQRSKGATPPRAPPVPPHCSPGLWCSGMHVNRDVISRTRKLLASHTRLTRLHACCAAQAKKEADAAKAAEAAARKAEAKKLAAAEEEELASASKKKAAAAATKVR